VDVVLASLCSLLVIFFGTRGQNWATIVGVFGAFAHLPQIVALAFLMAWASSPEPKNGV
jgi:hypothetical protein